MRASSGSSLVFALLLVGSLGFGAEGQDAYWQQDVHYTIDVKLDTRRHMLSGSEKILYRNNSPDTLRQFYLHLYPNAYRDEGSVRAREARRFYSRFSIPERDRGWIEIDELSVSSPGEKYSEQVIAFHVDHTILRAELPQPLPPGGELLVALNFREKVRKHAGRAGYRGKQYDFAQWYPKVVVYDEKGWHPEPFHFLTEFYGEFATFDVTITVPFDYIVGATGVVVQGDPGWDLVRVDTTLSDEEWKEKYRRIREQIRERMSEGDSLRTVTFRAERVHDFAWSASSDFLYERGEWDGVPVHVLYRSYAKPRWSKVVARRGAAALAWLSARFGRYPYPQLTIIHGLLGGGMEYPMLVMNSSPSEGLILHEVGHIYFYGILANNEQEEAWLDEGFTTFQTRWYMETKYGPKGKRRRGRGERGLSGLIRRLQPPLTEHERTLNSALRYMESGLNEPISRPGYRFREPYAYRANSYTKGSLFYEMLRYVVGDSVWDRICHTYFDRWKFKHVNEARFREVCEEVSGQDLGWFFHEWLHDSVLVDYALGDVERRRQPDGRWVTVVTVERRERGVMPVEVEVITETGERQVKRWDGKARKGQVTFVTDARVRTVHLDPRDQILDRNRLNNGTVRLAVYPLYVPLFEYPRDQYVLQARPSGWYNDVDGLRLGFRARGTYRGVLRNVEFGMWTGLRSGAVDGFLRYSDPLPALGRRARYGVRVAKLEGRYLAEARLQWTWSRFITLPPQHRFSLVLNYSDVYDRDYTIREVLWDGSRRSFPDWEDRRLLRAWLGYTVNPRGLEWKSNLAFRLEAAKEVAGGGLRFAKAWTEATLQPNWRRWRASVRLFAGTSFGDSPPLQDLYWIEGASPRERFERHFLRSRGALPPELRYHMPGGGNLRGYVDRPLAGESLVAADLELGRRLNRSIPLLSTLLGRPTVAVFVDVGSVWPVTGARKTLADAGVGVRFLRYRLMKVWYLRLDFPIWVSDPGLDGAGRRKPELDFRWLVSMEQVF